MSYILDALNKSEQERERKQPPRLTTTHQKPRSTPPLWRWLVGLLGLAILNTGLIWYWLSDPGDSAPVAAGNAPAIPEEPAAKTDPPEPVETPATRPEAEGELITPADAGTTQPVRISALPTSVQKQIPDLSFTSHIYSSEPDLRAVTINGRNVGEGASLANDLTLVEITEDGVILRYLHYTFEMSVIRDWSFE